MPVSEKAPAGRKIRAEHGARVLKPSGGRPTVPSQARIRCLLGPLPRPFGSRRGDRRRAAPAPRCPLNRSPDQVLDQVRGSRGTLPDQVRGRLSPRGCRAYHTPHGEVRGQSPSLEPRTTITPSRSRLALLTAFDFPSRGRFGVVRYSGHFARSSASVPLKVSRSQKPTPATECGSIPLLPSVYCHSVQRGQSAGLPIGVLA